MPRAAALGGIVGRYLEKVTEPILRRQSERRLRDWTDDTYPTSRPEAWWSDDVRWYPGGTPPRAHNRIAPLIDGGEFFPALRDALALAQHYVYIAGWFLTPYIPLGRSDVDDIEQSRLLPLLVETARRVPVRVLLWSGAPMLLQPNTRMTSAIQRVIKREGGGDLLCRLDATARVTHCHHQKAIVVDGQVAFVGGMDLTTYQGDRWDTAGHPLRAGVNWHDVQLHLQGEAVADVEQNFRQRWEASAEENLPPQREPQVDSGWGTPAQIVRTIPAKTYAFAPKGEFGIYYAYTTALHRARRLIYLENQYLWSTEIVDALKDVMAQPHAEPFRIVIVLPARAYSGKWDNDRHVKELREANRGRGIISFYCPYASGPASGSAAFSYRAIYVHAKVAVIDDEWFTVGSANLNERGLMTDSEINVIARDPSLARDLRLRLWAEHLGMSREEIEQRDTLDLIDHVWPNQAARNARIIPRADEPLIGALHPYQIGRMPGSWLLEEAELLTFEH
jgi:phosphatidylserine/phosphatidylglycerophosphate/cardiolipin synthase-like enzyme